MIICVLIVDQDGIYLKGSFDHLREFVDGFIVLDNNKSKKIMNIINTEKKVVSVINDSRENILKKENIRKFKGEVIEKKVGGNDWILWLNSNERLSLAFLNAIKKLTSVREPRAYLLNSKLCWEKFDQYRADESFENRDKLC